MVETHWRASSETDSHVIHRHLIKKVEQDTAHSIFYHELSILYFIWRDFKEPVRALHMHLKHTHGRFLFSIDLPFQFIGTTIVLGEKVISWNIILINLVTSVFSIYFFQQGNQDPAHNITNDSKHETFQTAHEKTKSR